MNDTIAPATLKTALSLASTCDACGYTTDTDSSGHPHHGAVSQAHVMVQFPSGRELLFCGHHYAVNELAVVAQCGVIVADTRDSLTVKPGASA